MGSCSGQLTFSKAGVSYDPQKGDHAFAAKADEITAAEQASGSSRVHMASFDLRLRDPQGKERSHSFIPLTYSENGGLFINHLGRRQAC
jgi:hypothetical protein